MSPTKMWIIGLAITLIAGGAMGALLTAYFAHRRNKRQPVVYTKEIIHIFRKNQDFENLQARLLVKEGPLENAPEVSVDYLSLVRLKITNRGNQDIPEFKFGVTMKGSNKVVDMRMSAPDRHHSMTVSFAEPVDDAFANKPDFTLTPFNRAESYSVDVYFKYEGSPGEIALSSPHSTELVEEKGVNPERLKFTSEAAFASALVVAVITSTTAAFSFTQWRARDTNEEQTIQQQMSELNEQLRLLKEERPKRELAFPSPEPSK